MVDYKESDFNIKELGSFYDDDKTIFRVFAPESKQVNLVINNIKYAMHQNGYCFEIALGGNLELIKYYYENDLGVTYKDPFSYYSDDTYSYVLNKAKFNNKVVVPKKNDNTVLYEVNVRDFSCDNSYIGDYKRKFLSLAETGLKQYDYYMLGLDYLCNLGISHIQLMPVLDFDLDHSDYNWGYNPLAYNYVFKDYVLDNNNPYAYINELRQTINTIHSRNLRVTLDVVFNHVYDVDRFDLEKMIPGHALRRMANGDYAKGSLCGSEIASEDVFVRAYIIEMCRRYIELFDIDGLRLDLMGILDYETINLLNDEMHSLKNDFIIYGEGWNMGDKLDEALRASLDNADKLPDIKMFNDYFRNTIINYVCGNDQIRDDVKNVLSGNNNHMTYNQTVNYIECHDNYTFFDRLIRYKGEDDLNTNIKRAKLGLSLVMLARGIPFIHMGQEFLRTKQLVDNSYNSSEDINKIDWNRRIEYNDVCDYLKALIEFRKNHNCFNGIDTKAEFEDYYDCLIYKLDDLWIFVNPSQWDYMYQDGKDFNVLFGLEGENCYTSSILAIPSYSILICKRF